MAGLPDIRDIGTSTDGSVSDLRPALRAVYDGGIAGEDDLDVPPDATDDPASRHRCLLIMSRNRG